MLDQFGIKSVSFVIDIHVKVFVSVEVTGLDLTFDLRLLFPHYFLHYKLMLALLGASVSVL